MILKLNKINKIPIQSSDPTPTHGRFMHLRAFLAKPKNRFHMCTRTHLINTALAAHILHLPLNQVMFLLLAFFFCTLAYQVFALPSGNFPDSGISDSNYEQKLGWFTRFADAFMFPNNTAEVAKINSTLFSEDVQGRADLTNTFDGRELNTEVPSHLPHSLSSEFQLIICSMYLDYFHLLLRKQILKCSIFWVLQLVIQ